MRNEIAMKFYGTNKLKITRGIFFYLLWDIRLCGAAVVVQCFYNKLFLNRENELN